MADTLPIDTDSPARADLAPLPGRKPTKSPIVEAWNLANPIGTWTVAYPGARGHLRLITPTRSHAFLTRSKKPAVFVEGRRGYILLTHVDPISKTRAGELQEQDHQLLDLDEDSVYPFPGAVYGSYLQLGGQS